MVELVDTSDLKSEGDYLRPGSSPGVRTIKNYYPFKINTFIDNIVLVIHRFLKGSFFGIKKN